MRMRKAYAERMQMLRPGCVAGLATAAVALGEARTAPLTPGKLVLGCGSNVVDHIYRVKGRPCGS